RVAREVASSPSDANGDAPLLARAKKLAADGLGALMARYARERGARPARPSTKSVSVRSYERSALVVAIAKLRADNRCELPNCDHPALVDEGDIPFTEVHHIEPLSEGGEDVLENVACLCPAHHREVHVGRRARELTATLRAIRNTMLSQPI